MSKCHIIPCKAQWKNITKVRVIHETGRKTTQTWKLCDDCHKNLLERPTNHYTLYKKSKKRAKVLYIINIETPF